MILYLIMLAQAAQPAQAVLTVPKTVAVGELVRFDASKSTADSFKWIAPNSDFQTFEGGKKAVFSARVPGEYQFILAVAKEGTVDVITVTITVTDHPNLKQLIRQWSQGLPRAPAVAAAFERVAVTAPATPEEWIKLTAEANRKALGVDAPKWRPFFQKLSDYLHARAEAGELTTPEQHKEIWLQIAEALNAQA